jgi:outer membrane cobalamin receptor
VLARAPRQVIRGLGLALGVALGLARAASAQPAADLKRMSLEELMNVEVVTFSRASERSVQIPAAVFVITQDDIRRSGATSLPEALRLAPGLQIARQDAVRYAMGTRGFADRLSRSMLVLIDGRAVYNPLFAGTYWEVQDTLLEDIDRIEVIRGPGGTLWGANAVNGIINILTKHSRDTQGLLLTGAVGNELAGPVGVRYGGSVGDTGQLAAGAGRRPQRLVAPGDADTDAAGRRLHGPARAALRRAVVHAPLQHDRDPKGAARRWQCGGALGGPCARRRVPAPVFLRPHPAR